MHGTAQHANARFDDSGNSYFVQNCDKMQCFYGQSSDAQLGALLLNTTENVQSFTISALSTYVAIIIENKRMFFFVKKKLLFIKIFETIAKFLNF